MSSRRGRVSSSPPDRCAAVYRQTILTAAAVRGAGAAGAAGRQQLVRAAFMLARVCAGWAGPTSARRTLAGTGGLMTPNGKPGQQQPKKETGKKQQLRQLHVENQSATANQSKQTTGQSPPLRTRRAAGSAVLRTAWGSSRRGWRLGCWATTGWRQGARTRGMPWRHKLRLATRGETAEVPGCWEGHHGMGPGVAGVRPLCLMLGWGAGGAGAAAGGCEGPGPGAAVSSGGGWRSGG